MVDLEEKQNTECKTGCKKSERKEVTLDDLCTECTSVDDNLALRCVGSWGKQKVRYLVKYFEIFAVAVREHWPGGLNYIEICSGPGRCINREKGQEFNGTPLAIVKSDGFKFLKNAFFFDINNNVVQSLNLRFDTLGKTNSHAYIGDYNNPDSICSVLKNKVANNQLNLILIDPTDCSVPFDFIRTIKKDIKNADLIINVAIGTDFNRNIRNTLLNTENYKNVYSKYAAFLGSEKYFMNTANVEYARNEDHQALRKSFRESYTDSLRELGYEFFGVHQIRNYYDLLYASKHPLGLNLWKKANNINPDGQRELGLNI